MKKVTITMVNIWKMQNIDWMGYKLQKNDMFTFHHLEKKEDGGKEIIRNGAVLCGKTSHPYNHLIEMVDLDIYLYLRKILTEVNQQRYMPTKEQLLKMFDALERFEREHDHDTNKQGKILIKGEYKRRIIL